MLDAAPAVMPCHEPAKARTSWPPVCSLASRSAASLASPPVERNIARASGAGRTAISSRASSVTSRERKPLNRCTTRPLGLAHRLEDRRVAVAERRAHLPGGEVEDPPAVLGRQPAARRVLDEQVGELAAVADEVVAAGAGVVGGLGARRGGQGGAYVMADMSAPAI